MSFQICFEEPEKKGKSHADSSQSLQNFISSPTSLFRSLTTAFGCVKKKKEGKRFHPVSPYACVDARDRSRDLSFFQNSQANKVAYSFPVINQGPAPIRSESWTRTDNPSSSLDTCLKRPHCDDTATLPV